MHKSLKNSGGFGGGSHISIPKMFIRVFLPVTTWAYFQASYFLWCLDFWFLANPVMDRKHDVKILLEEYHDMNDQVN